MLRLRFSDVNSGMLTRLIIDDTPIASLYSKDHSINYNMIPYVYLKRFIYDEFTVQTYIYLVYIVVLMISTNYMCKSLLYPD